MKSDVDGVMRLLSWCRENGVVVSDVTVGACTVTVAAVEQVTQHQARVEAARANAQLGPVAAEPPLPEPKDFYEAHRLRKLKKAGA